MPEQLRLWQMPVRVASNFSFKVSNHYININCLLPHRLEDAKNYYYDNRGTKKRKRS